MASEGCAGPKLTFGGGPQRIRSRKQSVPQRSCVDSAIINPTQPNQTLLPASLDSNPAAPVQHSELLEATPFSSGPLLVENAGLHAAAAAAAASHAAQWAGKASATSKKSEGTPKGSKDAPRPLKQGLCSFCSETWSPMWRRGPEQYPRLCNACGMRYIRKQMGAFDVKHQKPKYAGPAAGQLPTSVTHMPSEDDWQQVPAMPQSCNAAPRTQSTVAGAKRMRRLTAKALALDSSLADELEYSMAGKVDMAMQQVQLQGEQSYGICARESDHHCYGVIAQQQEQQQPYKKYRASSHLPSAMYAAIAPHEGEGDAGAVAGAGGEEVHAGGYDGNEEHPAAAEVRHNPAHIHVVFTPEAQGKPPAPAVVQPEPAAAAQAPAAVPATTMAFLAQHALLKILQAQEVQLSTSANEQLQQCVMQEVLAQPVLLPVKSMDSVTTSQLQGQH